MERAEHLNVPSCLLTARYSAKSQWTVFGMGSDKRGKQYAKGAPAISPKGTTMEGENGPELPSHIVISTDPRNTCQSLWHLTLRVST